MCDRNGVENAPTEQKAVAAHSRGPGSGKCGKLADSGQLTSLTNAGGGQVPARVIKYGVVGCLSVKDGGGVLLSPTQHQPSHQLFDISPQLPLGDLA